MSTSAALENLWGRETLDVDYAGHAGKQLTPRPSSIAQLLAGTGQWADRTFLVQGSRRISFRDFLLSIAPAAENLRARGVKPGDNVMLLGYNSPDWVLALWAIWRAGAVPIMGNRWWSAREVEHALELTEPSLVVTDHPEPASIGLNAVISPSELRYDSRERSFDVDVLIDGFPETDLQALIDDFPPVDVDGPAMVIFTSGSSGAPKGVALSHRSVVANQHNLLLRSKRLPQDLDPNQAQSVTLLCTPLFHVGGVSNLLTNHIVGGEVVLTEGRFDPSEVLRLIETEHVENFGGVPTMAVRILEDPAFESRDLSSLRSWPLGGAPLPPSLLATMKRKLPQLEHRGLGNTWGLSESGGFLTGAGSRDLAERPGTVGRPYAVAEIRIADPDALGSGEVLVRSPTVMIGYLPADGLTEQPVDMDGWLHTGDLGHLDDDGYLYLDGRSKDIVIRGGENIACAQVELALSDHPDVVDVAVFGIPHPDLGEELMAVVVERVGAGVTEAGLRKFVTGTLAYFAIPTRWHIQTDRLPTLAGEKVDKKSLRASFVAGLAISES